MRRGVVRLVRRTGKDHRQKKKKSLGGGGQVGSDRSKKSAVQMGDGGGAAHGPRRWLQISSPDKIASSAGRPQKIGKRMPVSWRTAQYVTRACVWNHWMSCSWRLIGRRMIGVTSAYTPDRYHGIEYDGYRLEAVTPGMLHSGSSNPAEAFAARNAEFCAANVVLGGGFLGAAAAITFCKTTSPLARLPGIVGGAATVLRPSSPYR